MAGSWIIPALKAVLPHVKTIYDTAAPVFTKKKAGALPDPTPLLQQQISELQSAAAQNTVHVKEKLSASMRVHRMRRLCCGSMESHISW